jgi:hypothetical protein
MNYEAANTYTAHDISVYVLPPIAFAIVTDLVISVVRRFYYGVEEGSPWAALGRFLARTARLVGLVVLYLLRFALDRRGTFDGLRQAVLNAAPLPDIPAPEPDDRGSRSKKALLLDAYRKHPLYGHRDKISKVAAELCDAAGLRPGTARTYLYDHLKETL